MEVIAYIGVGLACVLIVGALIGGAVCAICYVRTAIEYKDLLPKGNDLVMSIGPAFIFVAAVCGAVVFFGWSFGVVFGVG